MTFVWRSLLYVPANNSRFIDKAHSRGADAIILDLEDSVPQHERNRARKMLNLSVAQAGQNDADILVRINRSEQGFCEDLDAAIIPGVSALMLPKVENAEEVCKLAEKVTQFEAKRGINSGDISFVVMIESPAALLKVNEIVSAHPRIIAAILGSEDFATATGMMPDPETLFLPKMLVLYAARAANIIPLGMIGTVADFKDLNVVRENIRRSKKFGFEGASCIHPSVVPILNKEMAPSSEEIKKAERIVDAYADAEKAGLGAITIDGMMIDVPVVDRAQAVLSRHANICSKEKLK